MEKNVLSRKVLIETAPVHIAPGGSVLFHLTGHASGLYTLLSKLMEEIAYGMSDVETVEPSRSVVRVDIYMGKADVDEFMRIFSETGDLIQSFEREELEEGVQKTGFNMTSRNAVIRSLAESSEG